MARCAGRGGGHRDRPPLLVAQHTQLRVLDVVLEIRVAGRRAVAAVEGVVVVVAVRDARQVVRRGRRLLGAVVLVFEAAVALDEAEALFFGFGVAAVAVALGRVAVREAEAGARAHGAAIAAGGVRA